MVRSFVVRASAHAAARAIRPSNSSLRPGIAHKRSAQTLIRHAGPPLGIVATIFVVLFDAGLLPVTASVEARTFPVRANPSMSSPPSSAPDLPPYFYAPHYNSAQR
jgi:hypothetical protein